MRTALAAALCATLVAASALGCRGRAAPRGAPTRPASRVVSLAPSATETLFALGAGDRVVGVSTFDDYPPEVTRRPRVGGVVNPSFEGIAALRPDALVGVQGPVDRGVLDRVGALGVRVLFPRVESIEEVLGAVETFAALVGREPAGRDLRAALRRELDAVSARVAGRRRPRVIAVFNVQPLVVAGRGSWVDEVITAAGGENAIATAVRYPTVSVEVVLQAAPEVIFDMTLQMGGGDLRAALSAHGSPRSLTPARVVVLSDPLFVRPGPRVGEAVRRLAAVLHPEAVQ